MDDGTRGRRSGTGSSSRRIQSPGRSRKCREGPSLGCGLREEQGLRAWVSVSAVLWGVCVCVC